MKSVDPLSTPVLYRTRVTHLRRAPVHHYFELNTYSWYVDLDALPRLPRWARPFATFRARDHFDGVAGDTLRARVDAVLADRGIHLGGGRITALLQPRVLGYTFNPLSLYWCHDAHGVLRHVLAEVRNGHGEWYAYVIPPDGPSPAMIRNRFLVSAFAGVDGYYLVRAPRPDRELDVTISLHRDNQPAIIGTLRGSGRPASLAQVLGLQVTKPLAPQMNALSLRVQGLILRARGVPTAPRAAANRPQIRTASVAHS